MKSKYAFGNSDAAVYLAEYLMKKNNSRETRRVSAKLCHFNTQARELVKSDLSPELKFWALNRLQRDFADIERHNFTDDKLILDLIANVTRGKIRDIFRDLRVRDPRYIKFMRKLGEYTPTEYTQNYSTINTDEQ
jgi:hypothetical protein